MVKTIQDLRIQAWLLIVVICGLLSSLLSVFAQIYPRLPIPGRFELSLSESVAVVLVSLALSAELTASRLWAILSGSLLLLLAGYSSLSGPTIAPASFHPSDSSPLQSESWPPLLLLMAIPAASFLLGFKTNTRQSIALIGGALSVAVGVLVIAYHLIGRVIPQFEWLLGDISPAAGLFYLCFGIASLLLANQGASTRQVLSKGSVAMGSAAVITTFTLVALAAWGTYASRNHSAITVLEHHAKAFNDSMKSQVNLIERMIRRWAVLEFNVPEQLKELETRRYLDDTPALQALLFFHEDQADQWRVARSPTELLWLMDQVVSPETLKWMRHSKEQEVASSWRLPDTSRPFMALVIVSPHLVAGGRMLAVFDLKRTLQESSPQVTDEFTVTLELTESNNVKRQPDPAADVYEELALNISSGPALKLVATAGPLEPYSLRAALPPMLFIVGLLVSYLLTTGRDLIRTHKKQTHLLAKSEQRFRSLFSQSPNAVFAFDKDGHFQALNRLARNTTRLDDTQLGITHYNDVIESGSMPEADQHMFDTAFRNAAEGHTQTIKVSFTPQGSNTKHYDCDFLPIVEEGLVTGVFTIAQDITERVAAEENQRIFKRGLESSDNAVLVVDERDPDRPIVFANPAFTAMTGYDRDEVVGTPARQLAGIETDPDDLEQIRSATESGRPVTLTLKSYRKDGSPFWNQVSVAPVHNNQQIVTHFVAIMKDISVRKEEESQLAHQATHDALTGLGNRALFEDHLSHDFALSRRHDQPLAVLFVDLDEFKPINDTLGHKIGDDLLISVADRLSCCIRPIDTLVRFGGDEFVLVLPDLSSLHEAEDVAERILGKLSRPHIIGEHELNISASIGISVLSAGVDHPEKLLQQADMAMYKAKQRGRNTYEIFTPDLDTKVSKRVTLRNDLQEAIQSAQLQLHYQPQTNEHGELCGIEALIRWKHPVKGFISPAEFIPIAEETGQIIQVGKWVTTQACQDAQKLRSMGLLRGRMAVNLSPMQFHRPTFMAALRATLEKTGLPPEYLELELTEGILMKDTEGAIDTLHALSGMGIATAIDDFGTGFSSFSYLRDLPVNKIKIDRSFVERVPYSERDAKVCRGVITLAREMDLNVVAEGVETADELEKLKEFGCGAFQGYYFARPMPFADLVQWIRS
ncbi:MAG: EAL domain-containing protein [Marinobacter sp.]|uniref:EAL domain-containing protein n=1 Tax=Marinobacter sp. TaxID=50741 RepID=UPI00396ED6FD